MFTGASTELAAEAWRLLVEYFFKTAHGWHEVLRKFGLTPNEARALRTLSNEEGATMGSLADLKGLRGGLEKLIGTAVTKNHD